MTVEAEGKTIDDAIDAGLRELGIDRAGATVEILADAKPGLLGFGAKNARVRVSVRGATQEAPADAEEEVAAAAPAAAKRAPKPASKPEAKPAAKTAPAKKAAKPRAPKAERAPKPAAADKPAREESGDQAPREEIPARPIGETASILATILEKMGIEATVGIGAEEDGASVLTITSDAGALLIGKHGQTLDSIEYIVNRVAGSSNGSRVVVDTEGYRERRRESLSSLAERTAEKVSERGRPTKLAPMNPRDRRIVHLALREDESVETRSVGRGYLRQVIVSPNR